MESRLKVVEVWGIPIRVHVSWLLVFGLVTWSLAAGYFPGEYPGWAGGSYWAIAAVTALAFFVSILIHELGHSWVARRNGIPIRSITLFVFGGMARISREPDTPGAEFRIALAGPVTSFALAGLFAGAWQLVRDVPLLAAPAIWLARINFLVAVFNLVPGFPLDGGRLFRAAVWHFTGSFHRASRVAAFAGQLVAFGLIGWGILTVMGGNVIGGMWFAFIGWFLQNAAAHSHAEANIREMLRDVTVAQAMTPDGRRLERGASLERIVREEVLGAGRRCFTVTEGGRLAGLLTLHEIKAIPQDRWAQVTAGEVMTPAEKVTAVEPKENLLAALEKMDDANVAQMPVLASGELVGMIGREQILHYIRVRGELGV
ncbi:MAG TPA: site-2 protease family protein [Candidatus Deferrimicrobiaceae bacterium]|nr:site-2 protease family protein [Candidatus Deferrimicrobiaceae bacterium]